MVNNETAHALKWLRLVATCNDGYGHDQGYILKENDRYFIKTHGGFAAEPPELPSPAVFNYLLQKGFITPEGPDGEPHRHSFLTEKGKAAATAGEP